MTDARPQYPHSPVPSWTDDPTIDPFGRVKFQDRRWVHLLLFSLTALTTTFVGLGYYVGFLGELGTKTVTVDWLASFGFGAWFSVPLLAIMTAHEFGHYLACRRYRIDASLPFYIPILPVFIFALAPGTLGAVIRIREPILSKRALFDIGIAGPLAGFVLAVPILYLGLTLSNVAPTPRTGPLIEFGEPLAFQFMQWLVMGPLPQGTALNAHPMTFAGWWGLFVTAFNLIPAFQLDGGHIAYSVLGKRSAWLTYGVLASLATLSLTSPSWIFPTVLLAILIYFFGPHHPPVVDERLPLSPGRRVLAAFAVAMFVACFTPTPFDVLLRGGR